MQGEKIFIVTWERKMEGRRCRESQVRKLKGGGTECERLS